MMSYSSFRSVAREMVCLLNPWLRLTVLLLAIVLVVAPTSALAGTDSPGSGYVVQPGDTLADIAARLGISMSALVQANGILNANLIYADQVLVIPGTPTWTAPETDLISSGSRWIDVDLSHQRLTAYEGDTPVFSTLVSTGSEDRSTPDGKFAIEYMVDSQTMSGEDYHLPDVPYVMYFADYFAIHGAYWHSSFGYPVSHGCVNLPISAAAWVYNWVSIGTPVVIHY